MCSRNFCDYDKYYSDQAGGALDIAYYTSPYQRGTGPFSALFKRFGIPAMKYLFKQGIQFGKDVYSDIREGKNVKESLKSNATKRAGDAIKDVGEKVSQMSGRGLRKKPRLTPRKRRRTRRKSTVKRKPSKKTKRARRRRTKSVSDIFG